jgi:hypothetical protein
VRDGNGGRPEGGALAPDPAALEAAIRRIQGIQAARVVAGPGGRVAEVHVLAGRERGAKQLVRDVQSVILTNFGVDIDYRTVSVVQLDEVSTAQAPLVTQPQPPTAEPVEPREQPPITPAGASNRAAILRLQTETSAFTTEVKVAVAVEGTERSGAARGPSTSGLRIVAGATVDAVGDLLKASAVEVHSAELITVGIVQMAVVVLRLATSRGEQLLTGSAIVRKDANDSVARATLDALNRVLNAR